MQQGVATSRSVFISYAHEDIHRAAELAQLLEDLGVSVWWDRELRLGHEWRDHIDARLNEATKVIVLWTARSRDRSFVRDEANRAQGAGKLLQLVFDAGGVPLGFGEFQWRRVADMKDVLPEILASLGSRAQADALVKFRSTAQTKVHLAGLPTTSANLFGREIEMTGLLSAWEERKTHVFSLVAIGGTGKTALVRALINDLQAKGWAGASHVYGWSAYSQGSGENRNISAADFIMKALDWFGYRGAPIQSEFDRGVKLAEIVGAKRALLVIDGIEPLQELAIQDGAGVRGGRIRDQGLRGLLTGLADQNQGLCLVTSRQEIVELQDREEPAVRKTDLSQLDARAGRLLLQSLGVRGDERLIAQAAQAAGGHALTLNLLGRYIESVHGGAIAEARAAVEDLVKHGGQTGHDRAAHVMESYVTRFEALDENPKIEDGGRPELALLYLVGLFDRPADAEAIKVLRVPGLKPPLAALASMTPQRWATAVSRLRAQRLLLPPDPAKRGELDAHPLVRAHFGARLRRQHLEVFGLANVRLYEHYKLLALPEEFRTPEAYGLLADASVLPDQAHLQRQVVKEILAGTYSASFVPPGLRNPDHQRLVTAAKLIGTPAFADALARFRPDDLADMAPLFAAVAHSAAAGEHETAYLEVYFPRIRRGNAAYIVHELGALGKDLAVLVHFFGTPWSMPAGGMSLRRQALMLSNAAFALSAQGRLRDSEEAYVAAVEASKGLADDQGVAANAASLSEVRLALGDLNGAVAAARQGVEYADSSGDPFQRMGKRTTLADALHQMGNLRGAQALFEEAERMQAERQRGLDKLYSLPGYQYCDLLLDLNRAVNVRARAQYGLKIAKRNNWLLNIALDMLSLGRAAHALALGTGADTLHGPARWAKRLAGTRHTLDAAIDGLRKAGQELYLPLGLLARAALLRDMADFQDAARDLKETREIAERGEMRLFLADWHLETARLLLAQFAQPKVERGWFRTRTAPPRLTAEHQALRRQAEAHLQSATTLVRATKYHRRDVELSKLSKAIDIGL